jgi:transketolase
VSRLTPEQDQAAINLIRGLAMDAPLRAKSGHQGTAMALAPLGHVLYSRVMAHDPSDPDWPDRDRFVLSNGHASILQYALLYLNGYPLSLDDIKEFRQWESLTPGHPEAGHTVGVEVTTGPLGQGVANGVGMAIAERFLRARFGEDVQQHHTWVIAGDGCFMEGVSHEAASLAGHLGLGNLTVVYDDNHITIDGDTALTYNDDVGKRFEAYGWRVEHLGEAANDLDVLEAALLRSKEHADRPTLLILRSHIAYPSPDFTDDHEAHGNPFKAEDVARTKAVMGIPDEPFWSPPEVTDPVRALAAERGAAAHAAWQERYDARAIDPDFSTSWTAAWGSGAIDGWDASLPVFDQGTELATRQAIQKAFDAALPGLPGLVAGAADLTGNTGTKLAGQTAQSRTDPAGRQVHYGIREHGMGSAMVGMARHGGILPAGGTFFVFYDYMRPPVRLAALSSAKVLFVFTHDSVGVGEDGPTHQPVEQIAGLRAVPFLQVIRPADANETVEALRAAVTHDGPTALVLSRQATAVTTDGSAVARGAGIVRDADGEPDVILLATGTEVATCVTAAERLTAEGVAVRVVSLPSWDRFEAQSDDFQHAVLPDGVPVLSVEAASTFGWARWADASIGIDRFGASAPGSVVLDHLGINVDHIVQQAQVLVSEYND